MGCSDTSPHMTNMQITFPQTLHLLGLGFR